MGSGNSQPQVIFVNRKKNCHMFSAQYTGTPLFLLLSLSLPQKSLWIIRRAVGLQAVQQTCLAKQLSPKAPCLRRIAPSVPTPTWPQDVRRTSAL